jgi:hypothetical protein
MPVFSFKLKTLTGSNGTNDRVWAYLGNGEAQGLDNSYDDFSAGATDVYYIVTSRVKKIADIKEIKLMKKGSDSWSVKGIWLEVNNQTVYDETFLGDGVLINENTVVAPYNKLRAHNLWRYNASNAAMHMPPKLITKTELRDIIECYVGNYLTNQKDYIWGNTSGINTVWGDAVELEYKSNTTFAVDLDLEWDRTGINPELDVDFDLVFQSANNSVTLKISNCRGSAHGALIVPLITEFYETDLFIGQNELNYPTSGNAKFMTNGLTLIEINPECIDVRQKYNAKSKEILSLKERMEELKNGRIITPDYSTRQGTGKPIKMPPPKDAPAKLRAAQTQLEALQNELSALSQRLKVVCK